MTVRNNCGAKCKVSNAALAWVASLLLASGISSSAYSTPPDTNTVPVLRINSPFAANIWRADTDASEGTVVVSNADKAVSIWDLEHPENQLTARVPIRVEQQRASHAVAISGDGKYIAYSVPPEVGTDGLLKASTSAIYILSRDLDGGSKIVHVIGGPTDDVASRPQALRFSPDGAYLAGVLSSGCGVRVWETKSWKLFGQDDKGYGGDTDAETCFREGDQVEGDRRPQTVGVQFLDSKDGRPWLITSGDTGLRSYDLTSKGVVMRLHMRPKKEIDLDRPAGIALSPDGKKIVVGDRLDRSLPPPLRFRIAIVDPATLTLIAPPLEIKETALYSAELLGGSSQVGDNRQLNLDRVAWISDGSSEYIYGATFFCLGVKKILGQKVFGPKELCMARWQADRQDEDPSFIPIGTDRVMDILAMAKHRGLLLATQRHIGLFDAGGEALLDANSKPLLLVDNTAADYREATREFNISEDGRVVSFEDYRSWSKVPIRVTIDLAKTKGSEPPITLGPQPGLATIAPDQDPEKIDGWNNKQGLPSINKSSLPAEEIAKDEWHRSAAIVKDKSLVLLGSSQFLRLVTYEDGTPKVLCREPIRSDAYRVNITPDAKIAVTGHGDGTLRWYRLNFDSATLKCQFELLASAYLAETKPGLWSTTVWRPNGLFTRDGAARDSNLMEWQLTRSDGQIVRVPWSNGKLTHLYRPDLVSQALAEPPGERTKDDIQKAQSPDFKDLACRANVVSLQSPQDGKLTTVKSDIEIAIEDGCGWPKPLTVRMGDDQPVVVTHEGKRFAPNEAIPLEKSSMKTGAVKLTIELPPNSRVVQGDKQLVFYINGQRDSQAKVTWIGPVLPVTKRRLWAVLVGVSAYNTPKMNLSFASNDALDFAKLFITDFKSRTGNPSLLRLRDYDQVTIDLAVSLDAGNKDAKQEVDTLAKTFPANISVFEASRKGILLALDDIVTKIQKADALEPADNMFLFLFSGHGGANPYTQERGRTIFATSETDLSPTLQNLESTAITSSELLDAIDRIPGQKVIILDACRTIATQPDTVKFDPRLAAEEFEGRALSAHIFLSSEGGQESRETEALAYDGSRPANRRGNGVFSYAFLTALSDKSVAYRNPGTKKNEIRIRRIAEYLELNLFNTENADSPISKLAKKQNWPVFPVPRIKESRTSFPISVLRTLAK